MNLNTYLSLKIIKVLFFYFFRVFPKQECIKIVSCGYEHVLVHRVCSDNRIQRQRTDNIQFIRVKLALALDQYLIYKFYTRYAVMVWLE